MNPFVASKFSIYNFFPSIWIYTWDVNIQSCSRKIISYTKIELNGRIIREMFREERNVTTIRNLRSDLRNTKDENEIVVPRNQAARKWYKRYWWIMHNGSRKERNFLGTAFLIYRSFKEYLLRDICCRLWAKN